MAKKLAGIMNYKGHTVACPITPDGKLSHPLEEYFPHQDPEQWFEMGEVGQNAWVRRRLDGACPIFGYPDIQEGESVETHHDMRKGMGGKDVAKVPWAMIPALKTFDPQRSAHDLYHTFNLSGTGFKLTKWDWLDEEGGFEVEDEKGELVPHDKLFFYNRATPGRVGEALEWAKLMQTTNKEQVKALYAIAVLMAAGDVHANMLGYNNVKDWMAQHGMMTYLAEKGSKLFDSFHEYWDRLESGLVPVEMADLVRSKTRKELPEIKDEWVEKLLHYCSPLANQPSIAAFINLITMAFPTKVQEKKATLITGDNIRLEPVKVLDYGELFGRGGKVVKGWPIGTTEEE